MPENQEQTPVVFRLSVVEKKYYENLKAMGDKVHGLFIYVKGE
jgi:hypothetical protein